MDQQNQIRQLIARRQFMQGAAAAGFGTITAHSVVGSAAAKRGKTNEGDSHTPTLSTTDRLEDRRYVVAGTRAYLVGTEGGRFPAMGFHTRGEMGGVWSPPIKLLDGIWFGIDGEWLEPAERFTSSYGHIEMDLPGREGLEVTRTDFVPDETRAALFGLHFTADHDKRITLTVDARSELMYSYPWGATTPSQSEYNLADEGTFDGDRLVFRERGQPPVENAQKHDWAAVVGATHEPVSGETGDDFWGPQAPPEVAPAEGDAPKRYDDTAFGNGTGGQLRYEIELSAGETNTVWIAVAGADFDGSNPDDARTAALNELDTALDDPAGAFAEKLEDRLERSEHSRFSIPGNRQLERALDWSKQNLADCVRASEDLQIRDVDAGTSYPAPKGTVPRVRFLAAGYPDYPWMFATDGEYTAFASVAVGQFEPIKDHLRALRDVSEIANDGSGKVVHEVVFDGSVYFGTNDDPGNTDETVKFPSAVALVWRWTGDDDFRDELYDYAKRGMKYVFDELDDDGDGWLEGLGNVEREGMGKEKLDVTVYAIRGLYDLADMARSKDDTETATWAEERARSLEDRFEETWWIPEIPQHADSIDVPDNGENDNTRIYQRHWIGVTPMEAELRKNGTANPGLTTTEHGMSALSLRETDCYGGIGDDESEQRRNEGLYHTGAPGCDRGEFSHTDNRTEKQIFTVNTAVMAVGEGNYGRLCSDEQRRFIDANTKLQLPNPDEQPGAMPEIAPSPLYGRSIDKSLLGRAQVLQAWGNYGTVWPVVHQWLGVRPDMGRRQLAVVPQVPSDV
ncbi:MAG TPA: hypothetical protein VFJ06_14850, partial [Halococcus sp.]|nr:hypothetical protein [Halococcus sp.]